MTKRKKASRRKSSDSDGEGVARKQSKQDNGLDASISDAISEANSVLYECQNADNTQTSASQTLSQDSPNPVNSNTTSPKMATGSSKDNDLKEIREQMCKVLSTVTDIKSSQDSMRKSFDSKLDKMRNEFIATIDGKMRVLRDEIAIDINRESSRIDQLLTNLQSLNTRLETVEGAVAAPAPAGEGTTGQQHHGGIPGSQNNLDNPDMCIIVSGLSFQEDENISEKVDDLIGALGAEVSSNVSITGSVRLKQRFPDRPAYVKVSFRSLQEKVLVLRNKSVLKDTELYKDVYIMTCNS